MQEAPRVFISYSQTDAAFVRILVEGLESHGCRVDHDMTIRIGENFEQKLQLMRERARFIVIVMSRSYFRSPSTAKEYQFALRRESREGRVVILPVLHQHTDIPDPLRGKLYADFTEPTEYPTAVARLADTILSDFDREQHSESARQPDGPPTPVEFPDDLIEQVRAENCVLYAGSGLSAPAGLPTWQQFAEQLVRAAADADLVSLQDREFYRSALRDSKADYVVDEIVGRSPEEFIQAFLTQTFLGKTPAEAHRVVRDLPFTAVLTTNFDDLLEQTFTSRLAGVSAFTPHDTEPLLTAFTRHSFFILKLYGSLDRPASVLVSPAQFERAISENLPFQNCMESLFVSRTILFVGCSLEGIEAYLRGLRFRTRSNSRHYALSGVLGTCWEAMAGVLERRYGIHVIPCRNADVADQLHALHELKARVGTSVAVGQKQQRPR